LWDALRRQSSSVAVHAKGVPVLSLLAQLLQRRLRAKGGAFAFAPTLGSLNFLPDQRRRRGRRRKGLTGEEDDAGASRIELGGGEERDDRGWCEEEGARGEPFIGARGKGGRWSFLAPASYTVPPLKLHSAAEGTPRWGGTGEDAGQGEGRTERCQTSLCGEKTEGRTEATVGGDFGEGTAEGRRSN
jgi:hypothetical protein